MNPAHSFGSMVFSFQQIENDFVELFGLLLKATTRDAHSIIASNLSFSRLVDVVDALIRSSELSKEIKEEAETLIRQAGDIESERNKYVHSHYDIMSMSVEGITYERVKRRVKRNTGYHPDYERIGDSKAFDDLSGKMNLFLHALQDLTEKVFFATASQEEIDWYISEPG